MPVKDKVVAITGAARGMGRAYTQGFLAAGAKVVAMDISWQPSGFSGDKDSTFRESVEGRDDVLLATVDISDAEQIESAYEDAMKKFDTVDVLVNNAGLRQRDLFPPTGRITALETKDSDYERMFGVNVFGTLKVTRAFVRPMIQQKRGSIMSVVSSGILFHSYGGGYAALRPNSREQPYQATKAAIANMMFYLADELKDENVAVNIIIPGHTRTTGFTEQNEARAAMGMGTGGRVGPIPMRAEHVVPLAMFLAEQDASGISGRMYDTMTWLKEHGHGGPEAWADPD
jgi:NAD(P)-dependent dehydrogenase (short-subunit alcohol dehydrogenase family)